MDQMDYNSSIDLNVRIIQAVEYYPLLYKGNATIEERQAVWQQLSQQLQVPESVLKSRWHILCGFYQRCLEKRRSTDDNGNGEDGATRSDFRYEKELEFMMPYMHARITIAAANAARKQQELAAAGSKELTDPEFIITERDLENATIRMNNNNLGEEYVFFDVEALEGDGGGGTGGQQSSQQHVQQYHQQHMVDDENHGDDGDDEDDPHEQAEQQQHEDGGMNEEVIEEIDESDNVVQNLIIEGEELVNDDGEQIVVEEEEILAMDDQTVVEEIVENAPSLEEMHPNVHTSSTQEEDEELSTRGRTALIQGNNGSRRILRVPASTSGHKFVKIIQEATHATTSPTAPSSSLSPLGHHHQQQQQQHHYNQQHSEDDSTQPSPSFKQEYAVMPRRRQAVVLKATPRVQVELTDHTAAVTVANTTVNSLQGHEQQIAVGALDVAANAVVADGSCGKEETQATSASIINYNNATNKTHHQKQQQQHEQPQPQQKVQQQRHRVISHDSGSDHDNRSNDSNAVTTTAADNEEDHTSRGERSEDTIFGELVTAMLKHMPQDRKRAIKKSIMDILLT